MVSYHPDPRPSLRARLRLALRDSRGRQPQPARTPPAGTLLRIRSEAAFARLAGCAPIPASSGQTIRYRLDRSGDRQLNRALHMILVTRRRTHPPTIAYIDRRIRDGKAAAKQTAASSATSPAAFTDCSSIRHRRLDSYRSITGPLHSGRVRSALGNAGRCAGTVQVSHGRRWPKALSSHRRTHSVGRYGDTSLGNGHSRTRHRHHCRFRSAPRRPAATVAAERQEKGAAVVAPVLSLLNDSEPQRLTATPGTQTLTL